MKTPPELDRIVDKVLAYHPKEKRTKTTRKRRKKAKRA
jgi:hypothetical protein